MMLTTQSVTTSITERGVEVRDKSSGCYYFTYNPEAGQLDALLKAFEAGVIVGVETGKTQLQEEIRQVLGLNE